MISEDVGVEKWGEGRAYVITVWRTETSSRQVFWGGGVGVAEAEAGT